LESKFHLPLCILSSVSRRDYRKADYLTRAIAFNAFYRKTSNISYNQVWSIIDRYTGGLGYKKDIIEEYMIIQAGCTIAWPEAVEPGSRILEIGTGLGRTLFCILESVNVKEYYTIDISAEILSIALYRNPFKYFQEKLWRDEVYVINYDAVKLAYILDRNNEKYNHIIHDGGPNPRRNKRVFSKQFFKILYRLLKDNGTISVFAGRNPNEVSRICRILSELGFRVYTTSFPRSPVRVIHGYKIG